MQHYTKQIKLKYSKSQFLSCMVDETKSDKTAKNAQTVSLY